ncbi:hypothetical protein CG709_10640, partial [Lachnotalea glycerini]
GWALLVLCAGPAGFGSVVGDLRKKLLYILPKLSNYFKKQEFMKILEELNKADKQVKKNYQQYLDTQKAWKNLTDKYHKDKINN